MILYGIEPEHVAAVWPRAEPLLRPAIARTNGCYEPGDVLAAILSAHQQLWVGLRGDSIALAIVTEIVDFPRRRCLWIPYVGGSDVLSDTAEVMKQLEDWGRSHECDALQGAGRRGWIKSAGFRDAGATLWKDI